MSEALQDESILVRLQRDRAESDKLRAESEKLRAEDNKLRAEYQKLLAEHLKLFRVGEKLHWDKFLSPMIAIGGLIVGALGLLIAFFKH
jgi:cell division protein FtsB